MNGTKRKKAPDFPTFNLPSNYDENRYELWTVRLPSHISVQELHGTTIPMNESTTIVSNDQSFSLQVSNASETELFRILIPKTQKEKIENDSDSDSDDSDTRQMKKKLTKNELVPCITPIKKNLIITSTLKPHEEMSTTAVPPKVQVRRAYSHVPQKKLKRRWTPIGGDVVPYATDDSRDVKPSVKRARIVEAAADGHDHRVKRESDMTATAASTAGFVKEEFDVKAKDLSKKERKAAKKAKKKEKKKKKDASE